MYCWNNIYLFILYRFCIYFLQICTIITYLFNTYPQLRLSTVI